MIFYSWNAIALPRQSYSYYNAGEWRMKILIVEDDRTLNDGIALSLGRENVRQA